MNKSVQRDIVYEVLKSTKEHPTADTVYEMARELAPNISKGTVYRNLNQLVDNGMAIKVPAVLEKDRFDADISRHSHLICEKCGAVIDFDDSKYKINIKLNESNGAVPKAIAWFITDFVLNVAAKSINNNLSWALQKVHLNI